MWEFSINVGSENHLLAKYIFTSLAPVVESMDGVITSFEAMGRITIVLAVPPMRSVHLEKHIRSVLSSAICTFFKQDFLDAHLVLPPRDEIEIFAFKKALLFFDNETDLFLANKLLVIEKSIELESFFHFRLGCLKEKWTELVAIASDGGFISGDGSFVELLKFLIDNIDVSTPELYVSSDGDTFSVSGDDIHLVGLSRKDLIDVILTHFPQHIVWASSGKDKFLEKIFSTRIVYKRHDWAIRHKLSPSMITE